MTRTLPLLNDAACETRSDQAGFGTLETPRGRLPLLAVEISTLICGLSSQTTLRQTFRNSTSEFLEATYIFPLPDRQAVTAFEMHIAGRRIQGDLKERGQARSDYSRAIRDGHQSAIAEEERSGVFSLRVGNIPPSETVQVELTLIGTLPVAWGEATFRFPLVVAPRYTPGIPLDGESVGHGIAADTNLAPDASRVTPPVLLPGFANPVRLGLEVRLDPRGLTSATSDSVTSQWAAGLKCSLQATLVEVGSLVTVRLQPGERLDRDFILRIPIAANEMRTSLRSESTVPNEDSVFALTIVPPAFTESARPKPRDVVFVLDRSGSMRGWKMTAARRAIGRMIDSLLDHDRFTVIAFDENTLLPFGEARLRPATNRERWSVLEWLSKIDADGGTEMEPALTEALGLLGSASNSRDRAIVFVTDGQVTNEDHLLRSISRIGSDLPCLHCVGIDQAVNAGFLKRLSDLGRGACELVESEDRLDHAIAHVHRLIGPPVLRGIRIKALDGEISAVTPPDFADLFADRPLTIYGRLPESQRYLNMRVTGQLADGSEWSTELTAAVVKTPSATTAEPPRKRSDSLMLAEWGRSRVRDLEDRYACATDDREQLNEQIVAASLEGGVLSRFTAFVAVDQSRVVNAGGHQHEVIQPVELPAGWQPATVSPLAGTGFGPAPFRGKMLSRSAPSNADWDVIAAFEDGVDNDVDDSFDGMISRYTALPCNQILVGSLCGNEPNLDRRAASLLDEMISNADQQAATSVRLELTDRNIRVVAVKHQEEVELSAIASDLFVPLLRCLCELAGVIVPPPRTTQTTTFQHVVNGLAMRIELRIDLTTDTWLIEWRFLERQTTPKRDVLSFWK